MSSSRWLTWTQKAPVIEKMPNPEPPKPSKNISEGFEGATSELFSIVGCSTGEMDAVSSQAFRWIQARCVRRRDTWSNEKSLWQDHVEWLQQQQLSLVQRERFAEILDKMFTREMDGWQGIALAVDVSPSRRYVM